MVAQDSKLRRAGRRQKREARVFQIERPHKPHLDEMGIGTWHEVKPARPDSSPVEAREREDMGPPPQKLGRPGMRGGFKKRGAD